MLPSPNLTQNDHTHPKIVVLKFKAVNVQAVMVETIEEILRTQLIGTPDFELLERENIEQVLQEQKLNQLGVVDPTQAAQVGKLLGATHILVGSIINTGDGYLLNARLVNTEAGKVNFGVSEPISRERILISKIIELANRIKLSISKPQYKASSCLDYQHYGPEKAFDNDYSTRWIAARGNHKGWLKIDYNNKVTFSSLKLTCNQ